MTTQPTATKTDDGGPAFPTQYTSPGYSGMTLRDYFAATNDQCVRELSPLQAQAIMGCPPPNWSVGTDIEQNVKCVRWWAECEALMRYLHADAMLAARKAVPHANH